MKNEIFIPLCEDDSHLIDDVQSPYRYIFVGRVDTIPFAPVWDPDTWSLSFGVPHLQIPPHA